MSSAGLSLAALGCALALSACSGSDDAPPRTSVPLPAESSFAEGTCRVAAPDILAIGRQIDQLGNGPTVDKAVKDELRDAQQRLAELATAAEPLYKPALDKLVVTVGGVRIRADGNVYDQELSKQLAQDYRGALDVCT